MTTRRDYGTGSIRQLGPNRWQLRWSEGVDAFTGRHIRKSATFHGTKTDAHRELQRRSAGTARSSRMTVGELLDLALPALPIAERTRDTYRYALAHIPEPTRNLIAAEVTPAMGKRVIDGLTAKVGPQMVRKTHGALMSCWRHALSSGWVVINPWRGHRLPKVASSAGRAVTEAERKALFAAATDDLERLYLRLSYVVGGRPGELLGLRWSMWNAEAQRFDIHATKTDRPRVVHVDTTTAEMIRRWQQAQRERSLAAGATLAADPYLITYDAASAAPWSVQYARTGPWRRICERAGVTGLRPYDLRHDAQSTMTAEGIDPGTAARRQGNSPTVALRTYTHAQEAADRAAAEVLAARLV